MGACIAKRTRFSPCKGIQESLGLRITHHRFRNSTIRFRIPRLWIWDSKLRESPYIKTFLLYFFFNCLLCLLVLHGRWGGLIVLVKNNSFSTLWNECMINTMNWCLAIRLISFLKHWIKKQPIFYCRLFSSTPTTTNQCWSWATCLADWPAYPTQGENSKQWQY